MLNGYFVLGGPQLPRELPLFAGNYTGNHVGSRNRGQWVIDCALHKQDLRIPARDKTVSLLSSTAHAEFSNSMSNLDSSYGDSNYKGKLQAIQQELPQDFVGMVNNQSTSTHGSLAVITNDIAINFWGLHDTQLDSSYLVWSNDAGFASRVLEHSPLRYLLYRMPALTHGSLFLPGEVICARWWRLLKNHSSHLYAYNALERKLFS